MQPDINKNASENQNSEPSNYPIPPTPVTPPSNPQPAENREVPPPANPYAQPVNNENPPISGGQYQTSQHQIPQGYNSAPTFVNKPEAQKNTEIGLWLFGGSLVAYTIGMFVPLLSMLGFVANIVGAIYGSKGFRGGHSLGRLAFWLNLALLILSVLGFVFIIFILFFLYDSGIID